MALVSSLVPPYAKFNQCQSHAVHWCGVRSHLIWPWAGMHSANALSKQVSVLGELLPEMMARRKELVQKKLYPWNNLQSTRWFCRWTQTAFGGRSPDASVTMEGSSQCFINACPLNITCSLVCVTAQAWPLWPCRTDSQVLQQLTGGKMLSWKTEVTEVLVQEEGGSTACDAGQWLRSPKLSLKQKANKANLYSCVLALA